MGRSFPLNSRKDCHPEAVWWKVGRLQVIESHAHLHGTLSMVTLQGQRRGMHQGCGETWGEYILGIFPIICRWHNSLLHFLKTSVEKTDWEVLDNERNINWPTQYIFGQWGFKKYYSKIESVVGHSAWHNTSNPPIQMLRDTYKNLVKHLRKRHYPLLHIDIPWNGYLF